MRMTAVPIPPHELKRNTWYYGVKCACARLLAIAEDCFQGSGHEEHHFGDPFEIRCDCGAVIRTKTLQKFRSP